MASVPDNPKIFHITHLINLPHIVRAGAIWSDAQRIAQGIDCQIIGMSKIKERRLNELQVDCHAGTKVGDYVPFNFCPRSVMLYILHMGNHPDLAYRGGQGLIVHLVADLGATVAWAESHRKRWAFSARNAGAYYNVDFWRDLERLDQVNWAAVQSDDFRDAEMKEGKQAEFLLHESFPWHLVERIGVLNGTVEAQVRTALSGGENPPPLRVERQWYF